MDTLTRHTCSSIVIAGLGLMLLLTSGGCLMNEQGAASGAIQARGPVAMICPEDLNANGSNNINVRVIVKGSGVLVAPPASLRDGDGDSDGDSGGSDDSDGDSDSSSDSDGDSDSDSDSDGGGNPPVPLDPIRGYSLDFEYNPNHLAYVGTDESSFTSTQPPWAGLAATDQGDGSNPDIVRIAQLIQVAANPVSPNDGELLVTVRFTRQPGAPATTTVWARNASIGVDGTISLPDCQAQITF